MATYIPNAADATQPTEDKTVESAALEFRTLKASVLTTPAGEAASISKVLPAQATRANKLFGFNNSGEPVASQRTVAEVDAAVSSFVNATGNNAASILYNPESGPDTSVETALDTSLRYLDANGRVTLDKWASANGQLAGMRNKIINGKMDIAQRGTSFAAVTSGSHTLDRYRYDATTSAVLTISQQADVPSSNEFQYSLRATVTPTADTSITASDFAIIQHLIEGYNVRDLIGRTFTLSFWVRSSKTGTHCVALRNSTPDRSYVAEYTINAANTWEQKSITVSGGLITAGTWNWTTGRGLAIAWTLAAGSTYQTTANVWNTLNFAATSNQVNCLDTVGNIFAITGVQLEVGSVATPFEHRHYGAELALCQRYYETSGDPTGPTIIYARGDSGNVSAGSFAYAVEKRAVPTVILTNQAGTTTLVDNRTRGFSCSFSGVSFGRCGFTSASEL